MIYLPDLYSWFVWKNVVNIYQSHGSCEFDSCKKNTASSCDRTVATMAGWNPIQSLAPEREVVGLVGGKWLAKYINDVKYLVFELPDVFLSGKKHGTKKNKKREKEHFASVNLLKVCTSMIRSWSIVGFYSQLFYTQRFQPLDPFRNPSPGLNKALSAVSHVGRFA